MKKMIYWLIVALIFLSSYTTHAQDIWAQAVYQYDYTCKKDSDCEQFTTQSCCWSIYFCASSESKLRDQTADEQKQERNICSVVSCMSISDMKYDCQCQYSKCTTVATKIPLKTLEPQNKEKWFYQKNMIIIGLAFMLTWIIYYITRYLVKRHYNKIKSSQEVNKNQIPQE